MASNDQSNSVGNLLLHLNGNVRQWIPCGVGRQANDRHRGGARRTRRLAEGDAAGKISIGRSTRSIACSPAQRRRPAEQRTIGRDITVLDAIFHVTEHFSGHLGQII